MSDVRPQLESLLLERLRDAMATLPDQGTTASPARTELVERTIADFLNDVRVVVDIETIKKNLSLAS